MQRTRRNLLHDLPRGLRNVDVLAVDVVPGAAEEEGDVVREVETCGDEGQAEEEEYDRACGLLADGSRTESRRRWELKDQRHGGLRKLRGDTY